jgi:hypothetical protein
VSGSEEEEEEEESEEEEEQPKRKEAEPAASPTLVFDAGARMEMLLHRLRSMHMESLTRVAYGERLGATVRLRSPCNLKCSRPRRALWSSRRARASSKDHCKQEWVSSPFVPSVAFAVADPPAQIPARASPLVSHVPRSPPEPTASDLWLPRQLEHACGALES